MPSVLLSGSTDGLVNLYDTTITDEDDALTQVFNHGYSIAHTGFLLDPEVFALSHDEIFSVYDTDDDDTQHSAHHFGDLRPQLHCDYVVDLVNSFSTRPLMGAGSHSCQNLDIVPLHRQSGWTLDVSNTTRLPGAHGDDIVRSICFGDDEKTIFTAGEDGLIKAWRASAEDGTATETKDPGKIDRKRKKHKSIDSCEGVRFNPC
ncbi:MAG: hypothetical protein Q9179_003994 [Wetmoreana sp. 5 TL-2023]